VGIAIADQHIEHQPAKEPRTRHRWGTAGTGQCGQIFHATLAVFEAAIQSQQLARIDHVPPLPALTCWNPVKAIDQIHG